MAEFRNGDAVQYYGEPSAHAVVVMDDERFQGWVRIEFDGGPIIGVRTIDLSHAEAWDPEVDA